MSVHVLLKVLDRIRLCEIPLGRLLGFPPRAAARISRPLRSKTRTAAGGSGCMCGSPRRRLALGCTSRVRRPGGTKAPTAWPRWLPATPERQHDIANLRKQRMAKTALGHGLKVPQLRAPQLYPSCGRTWEPLTSELSASHRVSPSTL